MGDYGEVKRFWTNLAFPKGFNPKNPRIGEWSAEDMDLLNYELNSRCSLTRMMYDMKKMRSTRNDRSGENGVICILLNKAIYNSNGELRSEFLRTAMVSRAIFVFERLMRCSWWTIENEMCFVHKASDPMLFINKPAYAVMISNSVGLVHSFFSHWSFSEFSDCKMYKNMICEVNCGLLDPLVRHDVWNYMLKYHGSVVWLNQPKPPLFMMIDRIGNPLCDQNEVKKIITLLLRQPGLLNVVTQNMNYVTQAARRADRWVYDMVRYRFPSLAIWTKGIEIIPLSLGRVEDREDHLKKVKDIIDGTVNEKDIYSCDKLYAIISLCKYEYMKLSCSSTCVRQNRYTEHSDVMKDVDLRISKNFEKFVNIVTRVPNEIAMRISILATTKRNSPLREQCGLREGHIIYFIRKLLIHSDLFPCWVD